MDKIRKDKIFRYIPIIPFIIFLILMILQFINVFVYYDDYGFASLSYSNSIDGVNGLHYNLPQLIKFLYLYYRDWGGRVISFGTEALLLKNGVIVMQIAMAITVTSIVYFLYKIIEIYKVTNKWFTSIAICSLYGLIHIAMLRDSFYWYTSSVIYVMPFMPYLIGVYYYANNINKQIINNKENDANKWDVIKNIMIAFIIFIAAFSQEQVAISLSFMIVGLAVFKYINLKKFNLWDIVNSISVLIGTILVVFAPGNTKRMDEQIDFYNLPLVSRTLSNVDSIFKEVFGYKFIYIMTAYVLALALISIVMIIKKYGIKLINFIFLIINTLLFLLFVFKEEPLYNFLENKISKNLIMLFIFLYFVFIVIQITIYYIKSKKQIMLILFFASICTISSMAFIPCITIRCYVPFVILSFGIIVDLATTFVDNVKYGIIVGVIMLLLILPFSYKNYSVILDGYKINSEFNINNDKELKKVSEDIKKGTQIKSVELHKLNNTVCSNVMQYEEGYEFIKVWMCEYYDIPQDIEFVWIE
ncbi:MAG: DUF6056 family protein [Clostridiaceae bacterium]